MKKGFILAGVIVLAMPLHNHAVVKPFKKIQSAAENLSNDITCVATNSCTQQQKDRIQKRLKILGGLVAAGTLAAATIGTDYVVSKKKRSKKKRSNVVNKFIKENPELVLSKADKDFLDKIYNLVLLPLDKQNLAIDTIIVEAPSRSVDGIHVAVKLLDQLPDFSGKEKLRVPLVAQEQEKGAAQTIKQKQQEYQEKELEKLKGGQ